MVLAQHNSHRSAGGAGGNCVSSASALGCQLRPHLLMSHHVKEENEHTLQREKKREGPRRLVIAAEIAVVQMTLGIVYVCTCTVLTVKSGSTLV